MPSYGATLVDGSSGEEISVAVVTVVSGSETTDVLVMPGQEFEFSSRKQIVLLVRSNFSESYTHYAQLPAGSTPKTIIVHPGTLLIGQVRTTQDNLLAHVPVSISCPSYAAQIETDDVGMFRIALPADECLLAAEAKGSIGSTTVALEQGVPASATIIVDYEISGVVVPSRSFPLLLILTILFGLAVAGFILWRWPSGDFTAERVKNVLKGKEATIVDALIARGGKATLSHLRSDLRIPRTSLLRTLHGLEQRNVLIKREEHGKVIIALLK
jgi:uncharacterized membrane protein